MTKTGKVTKITASPRGFRLHVPEPPPDGEDFDYTCDADQLTVAAAVYAKGSDADVDGTPPACTGVTGK